MSTGGFGSTTATAAGSITGNAVYDAASQRLTVTPNGNWSYALELHGLSGVRFYRDLQSMLGDSGASTTPTSGGYWAANLPGTATSAIGVGFATAAEGSATAATRATAAANPATAAADVQRWTGYWNGVLAKVPVPQTFGITDVPANGVTGGDVERSYYLAWVLNQENVLPVMPETGYAYPQVATGKASGWMKGPDGSRPSATWDSLLGMQYLAYIDPATAVQAFKGMMTLTDAQGQLGGESLPSLKAKTAWTISEVTGDSTVLTDTYTDLRRYLDWAAANPRWIYGSYDHANEHDSEFAISLLIDYDYAQRIAKAIGRADDVKHWKDAQTTLSTDYDSWFLQPDRSLLQYFFTGDPGSSSAGTNVVVASGLHATTLSTAAMAATLKRFDATYDPSKTLAGLNGVGDAAIKAPDAMFTAYGLLDQGRTDDAAGWVEAILRDVVKTGQFAETYKDLAGQGLTAGGVRPSVFGAANVIDFVWLLNGVRSDLGTPTAVNLTGRSGGVDGLHWNGEPYAITTDATGTTAFTGTAMQGADCTTVALQRGHSYTVGQTTDVACSSPENPGGGNGEGDGEASRHIEITVDRAAGTITAHLDRAYASGAVGFVVHSTPTRLGTRVLDASGTVTLRMPNGLESGTHTLVADIDGTTIAEGTFVWSGDGTLAFTGVAIGLPVALALLLLLVGAGVVVGRRMRAARASAE